LAILIALAPAALSAQPIRLSGHVMSPDGSQGIAGVQIELLPDWEGYAEAAGRLRGATDPRPLATARTDADGFYEIAAPEAGAYRLRLRADRFLPMELSLGGPVVEDMDAAIAHLSPAEPADVRVISGDGKPLPGLAVRVLHEPSRRTAGDLAWHIAERSGVTDGAGRLALSRMHGETLKIVAVSPAFLGQVAVLKAGSQPLRFLARPASKLEVRDTGGKPVADAVVRWRSWPIGMTGADGRLALAFPPGGEPLRAESRDGGSAQGAATPGSKDALLSLRLDPPRAIAGQVLQQSAQKPVPNALVWAGSRLLGPPAHTGADGRFQLTLSTTEEVALEAAAPGYLRAEGQFVPRTSTTPSVLRLEPAARLSGLVVDAAGRPVPQTYVLVSTQGSKQMTLSRPDGRFVVSGLRFQTGYEIRASRPGFIHTELKARTPAPGQTAPPVRIVLGSGAIAFGHVVDEAGSPVPGAKVTLTTAGRSWFPTTTDAEGRFEFRALETGKATLRVRSAGFSPLRRPVEIPPGAPKADFGEIELPLASLVEGEVTDTSGTPIAGAAVISDLSAFDDLQWILDESAPRPGIATGADGRFRLTELPLGTAVRLRIEHEGFLPLDVPGVKPPLQGPLHLEMKTARGLSGRVVGPAGEPVAGASLSRVEESRNGYNASTSANELGITDPAGAFQLSGLAPGPNDLRVTAQGYATRTVRGVNVPQDRDLEGFEIVLGRGAILQVRVLSVEGGPVAGAWVNVRPTGGVSGPEAVASFLNLPRMRTDEQGVCQGELPNPGEYRITAAVDRRTASAVVQAGPGTTPAEIRFQDGVQASGRVTDPQGQGLSDVSLLLTNQQDHSLRQSTSSAEDGSFAFRQVPDGTYRLYAERQGFTGPAESPEIAVGGSDVQGPDLQMRPVTGATLTGHLLGLPPEEVQGATVRGFGGDSGSANATVDPDGHYEIKNVGPGDWSFTAKTTGQRLLQQNIKIQPGDAEAVLDFEFKGGTLSGTILVDGSPLSGANVGLSSASSEGSRSALSRYDGRFEIRDVIPGAYRLSVTGSLGAVHQVSTVEIDGDRELAVEIAMGTLAGHVVSGGTGEGVADATVSIEGQEAGSGSYSTPTTRSGEQGLFDARLSPGAYRIKVQKDGYAPVETTAEVRSGEAGSPVEIRLKPVGSP
jgi:outer membrane lipoprotein SlyB